MKNISKVILILLIIAAFTVGLVSCKGTEFILDKPEGLIVSGNTFSWKVVEKAEGYEVIVDEGEPTSTKNNYIDITMTELRTYNLKVRAFAHDENGELVYSEYSSYSHTKTNKLNRPQNIAFDATNNKIVRWDSVEKADSYEIKIYNQKNVLIISETTKNTFYSFDETGIEEANRKFSTVGRYTLEVTAKPAKEDSVYVVSDKNTIVYCVQKQLEAPKMSAVTSTSVRWEYIGGSTAYKLFVYHDNPNGDDELVNEFKTTSTSYAISRFDLATYGPGTYYCKVQAIGDETEDKVYLNSEIGERDEKYDLLVLPSLKKSQIEYSDVGGAKVTVTLDYIYKLSSVSFSLQTTTASGSALLSSVEQTIFLKDANATYVLTTDGVADSQKHYYIKVAEHYDLATKYIVGATYYTYDPLTSTYTIADSVDSNNFASGEYYIYTPEEYVDAPSKEVYTAVADGEAYDSTKVYYTNDGTKYVEASITKFEDGVTYYTRSIEEFSEFEPGVEYYELEHVEFVFNIDDKFDALDKDSDLYYGKLFTIKTTVVGSSNNVVSPAAIVLDEKYLSYKKPNKIDNTLAFEEAPQDIKSMFDGQDNYSAKYQEFADNYNGYYYVTNMGELQYMRVEANANYVIIKDLNNQDYEWSPIPQFDGILDGYNHQISKIVYCANNDEMDQELAFILENRGTIKNLFFVGVSSMIEKAKSGDMGGIVYNNEGTIENCFVSGSLSYMENIGGIAVKNANTGKIKNSQSMVSILGHSTIGGIAAFNYGIIEGCYSTRNITASSSQYYIGDYNALKKLYEGNSVDEIFVEDGKSIGVYTDGNYLNNGEKYDAYYKKGSSSIYAGGLVGYNTGTITSCYALGSIKSSNSEDAYVGGLVGYNYSGDILYCYAGAKYSVDVSKRTTIDVSAKGNVAAGGLVGRIDAGTIKYSYSTNRVSASDNFGGFVGLVNGVDVHIYACYSLGGTSIQSSPNKGAFVGNKATGAIDECYFYNYFTTEDYNNIDSCATRCLTLAELVAKMVQTNGFDSKLSEKEYKEPTIKNMIYTNEYELTKGSGGYVKNETYLVVGEEIKNITAEKSTEYITVGDNTRKGTVVVVLDTGSSRVAFLVTIK